MPTPPGAYLRLTSRNKVPNEATIFSSILGIYYIQFLETWGINMLFLNVSNITKQTQDIDPLLF